MTPDKLSSIKNDIIKSLYDLSNDLGELPMPKRSHGQAAQICNQYANQISEYLDRQLSGSKKETKGKNVEAND